MAGHDGGGGPADVARLQTEASCGIEIDLDLNLRNVLLQIDVQIDETFDVGERLPHLVGLGAQDGAEIAEDTRARTTQPQMMIGHTEGLLLRLIVRIMGARRVLEIGTFTGYSALAMASALPDDGTLVTCDVDPAATSIVIPPPFFHGMRR